MKGDQRRGCGREGQDLRALVDEQQQNKIAELKHEIRFLFSKVNVYGLRSTEGGVNSGKDPEDDAPKDNEDKEDKGEKGDAVPTTPSNSTEEREENMETGEEDPMSQNPPSEEEEDLLDEEILESSKQS